MFLKVFIICSLIAEICALTAAEIRVIKHLPGPVSNKKSADSEIPLKVKQAVNIPFEPSANNPQAKSSSLKSSKQTVFLSKLKRSAHTKESCDCDSKISARSYQQGCPIILPKYVTVHYDHSESTLSAFVPEGTIARATCDSRNEVLTNGEQNWTGELQLSCLGHEWSEDIGSLFCHFDKEYSCNNSDHTSLYINEQCFVLITDRTLTFSYAEQFCQQIEWYSKHNGQHPHLAVIKDKASFIALNEMARPYGAGMNRMQHSHLHFDYFATFWVGMGYAQQNFWLKQSKEGQCSYLKVFSPLQSDDNDGFGVDDCNQSRYAICQMFDGSW